MKPPTGPFSSILYLAAVKVWDRVAGFVDHLCAIGDATCIPADTRKRMVINCKCPNCGLTQLVGGVMEYGEGPAIHRTCECGTIINYHQHRVGDWEFVS